MIKSQHELTTPKSSQSDVLIEALNKCQKLERQLKESVESFINAALGDKK